MKLSTRPTSRSALRRSERVSLLFFAVVAAAFGIAIAVSASGAIAGVVNGAETHLLLSTAQAVPLDAATGPASLISGTFESANVVISGLNFGSRALIAGGILARTLTYLALALTIVVLCIGLFRGRPFTRSVTWMLTTASLVLMTGGLMGSALTVAGQFAIAAQLNSDPTQSVFPFAGNADLVPVFIGLGLGAVAAAFEIGERLQRDTEGLV